MGDRKPDKYYLSSGTVSAFLCRDRPWTMRSFGCAVYERDRPVLSHERASVAQEIVDRLNAGLLTEGEAMDELNRKAFF